MADDILEANDLPLDSNFVEQAEYIDEEAFLTLNATHPEEESIIRRLGAGGAKLLVGPRGCGKTTLMLKAYYHLLRTERVNTLPIYVNFKLSLKLEPLYQNTPNASFWFRLWLNLKIYEGLHAAIETSKRYLIPSGTPTKAEVTSMITAIESGHVDVASQNEKININSLADHIGYVLEANGLTRCVLLLDDAAHAFSPRQQEDFFEFFRQIKSRAISPKAAIYPGITTHSPSFHVGHDAEQIDVWVRPDTAEYVDFMRSLALKRFGGELPQTIGSTDNVMELLAFSSFGIPRSFLNMLRTIYHEEDKSKKKSPLSRRKILDIAKQGRDLSHNVYDSLEFKLPAFKEFVHTGSDVYKSLISTLKELNKKRDEDKQALEVGIKKPVPQELDKVFSFLQYAGLLMPIGTNSRGVKGVFDLYMVHFGDLVVENAVVGRRTKTISSFVSALTSQTHQAWPRVSPETLINEAERPNIFRLSLPNCQNCGAERSNEHAKFCQNCGAQLKNASLYDQLTKQDISVLPISETMVKRIKENSRIKTIKDILIDTDRKSLRSVPFIGPVRAARIAGYAEEHVA